MRPIALSTIRVGSVVILLLIVAAVIFSDRPSIAFLWLLLAMVFAVIVAFAGWYLTSPSFDQWISQCAVDGRTCRCGAPLDGLPDQGGCPECGIAYDARTLREEWFRAFPVPDSVSDVGEYLRRSGLVPGEGPARDVPLPTSGPAPFVLSCVMCFAAAALIVYDAAFFMLAIPSLCFVAVSWARWRQSSRLQRLIAHDFRECTRCGFDLRGLASPGRCPECNRAFTDRMLRAYWLLALKIGPTVDLVEAKARWFREHPEDRTEQSAPMERS